MEAELGQGPVATAGASLVEFPVTAPPNVPHRTASNYPLVAETGVAAPSGPPTDGKRPGVRWRLVVASVALLAAVGAAVVGVQTHSQVTRTNASLSSARQRLSTAEHQLRVVQAELVTATAVDEASRIALAGDEQRLTAARARLSGEQAAAFDNGVGIADLSACLAGVQQALNQISLGDPTGAGVTLRSVGARCQAAEPSG